MADAQDSVRRVDAEEARDQDFMVPDVDICETEEGLTLFADMPGVGEGGVEVSVNDERLTLIGRSGVPSDPQGSEIHVEFAPQSYRRVFAVSRDIDTDRIEGKISQGVLRLFLPKSDQAKVKRIPIESG